MMIRDFSAIDESDKLVGWLTMEEWLDVGGRDVVMEGMCGHGVEGEGWVGIFIAEGEREGPGATEEGV